MFRARIHAKVRDPVWWAMTLCFITILLWFSSKELTMAYLLYSPDALAHRVLHENYPLHWIYGTHGYITGIEAFSDTDSFMQKFIPVYTASYSDLVLQGIAKSTNVMILMHLFPPLYLARRIANGECLQLISIGHARTKVFWGMLTDTVFHMALLFLISGTLTWIASSWGYLKWDLEVFLHCQILRLPMLIAWLMPTVFVFF